MAWKDLTLSNKNIFLIIFMVSGFSGLIYESIWSHYLKLFLGHAAYAQSLVLAIFMGGMASGAWICSRYSGHWKNLLLRYAIIEAVIGVLALGFHPSFDWLVVTSYSSIIPQINQNELVSLYKWLTGALIIFPQSVLLGMTFPLMSGGLLRYYPKTPGNTLSLLYFSNSIGAVLGVLSSGFILIALAGLPGTMITAGILNLSLACVVWFLVRKIDVPPMPPQDVVADPVAGFYANSYRLYLMVAALTGAASFIYEIGWIRMLNLVLGSSTHAFELMLSAFILGLALGSLWIRKHIDTHSNLVKMLAIVQLIMGLMALSTLPIYNFTFDIMRELLDIVNRDEMGYVTFNITSHAIAALVMLPTTICAGMTLPLITFILIKNNHGEKSIGAVYAFNTLGAIVGVVFAIHIGMPLLGLKGLISTGAVLDLFLAVLLGIILYRQGSRRFIKSALVISVAFFAIVQVFVELNPYKMASGVYRRGNLYTEVDTNILFHKDGKSASIDLIRYKDSGNVTISTNGKPDATVNMSNQGQSSPDEATMILAAAIPLALHPKATQAGVIGMGSGLTSQALLSASTIASVDTVEIEEAIVEAANGFRPKVELVFSSPKSHIFIDDAKTYFSTYNKKYDIIVSEPSNPWVSGTSNLFTDEFYRLIKHHLNSDGVLVQWLQLYEINVELIASVAKALAKQFDDYVIYATDDEDIVFIAKSNSHFSAANDGIFYSPWLKKELHKIGVRHLQDLELHRIGDKSTLAPLFASYAIKMNSDYYPVLDLGAARTRFFQSNAAALVQLRFTELPALRLLSNRPQEQINKTIITPNPYLRVSDHVYASTLLRDYLLTGLKGRQYERIEPLLRRHVDRIKSFYLDCRAEPDTEWLESLSVMANATIPYLSRNELHEIWTSIRSSNCSAKPTQIERHWMQYYHAIAVGDAPTIAKTGEMLLALGIADKFRRHVILGSALGYIKSGNQNEAKVLLTNNMSILDPNTNLLDRLVYSHAHKQTD